MTVLMTLGIPGVVVAAAIVLLAVYETHDRLKTLLSKGPQKP